MLVNASRVRNVPGRKTDVSDASKLSATPSPCNHSLTPHKTSGTTRQTGSSISGHQLVVTSIFVSVHIA